MVGQALGRSTLAADLEADTEASIAAAAEAHPQIVGKSFIFAALATTDMSKIDYYTPADNRPRLLADLGMVNAPVIEEISEPGAFYGTVSAERAADLESDVFITYAETGDDLDAFRENRLLGRIPASPTATCWPRPTRPTLSACRHRRRWRSPTPWSTSCRSWPRLSTAPDARRHHGHRPPGPPYVSPRRQHAGGPAGGGTGGGTGGGLHCLAAHRLADGDAVRGVGRLPPRPCDRGGPAGPHPARAARRRRARAVRRRDAGGDPQPAGRPGHPRRHAGAALAVVVGIAFFGVSGLTSATSGSPSAGRPSRRSSCTRSASLGSRRRDPAQARPRRRRVPRALSSLDQRHPAPADRRMDAFRFWQIGGVGGRDRRRCSAGAAVPGRRRA